MSPQTQIQFQHGVFRKFVAARSFALGNSGTNIQKGGALGFDGQNYVYEGSSPQPMPQLRGAIKAGWIVLEENYDENDDSASVPKAAGVRMRAADGGNPMNPQPRYEVSTTDAEEREVGNVAQHSQQTRNANANRPGQRQAPVSNVMASAQEGREVRKLSNPAYQPAVDLEKTSATEAIRQLDRATKVQPGRGLTREEMVANLPEEERQEYLATLEAKRSSYADEDPQAKAERERNTKILAQQGRLVDSQTPQVVGRVASSPTTRTQDGFQITNHVGGGTETVDLSGLDTPSENKVAVVESEGMKFTTTNVGRAQPVKAAAPTGPVDSRRRIAKSICPDFPDNYVFEDSVRKKIARLQADYDDRPDVIQAAAAADTDVELRNRLVEEFPEAFT